MFLKMAAILGASGVLAWKPDETTVKTDEILISDEDWLADPPPFAPYYLEKPYAQYYENLTTLSYLSGLEIGEISVRVNRHCLGCDDILSYYEENGDWPNGF
jgi:hypothetical protein